MHNGSAADFDSASVGSIPAGSAIPNSIMSDTFAFIADTHLRSFQHGRSYRGQDFFNAFIYALESMRRQNITTVIHGGDLLDIRNPSSEVIDQLCRINAKANQLGMVISVITGNHDRCEPSWVQVLNNVLEAANAPSCIRSLDNEMLVLPGGTTIYGLPFMNSAELQETLKTTPEADFLVWHGAVKEFCNFPAQDVVTVSLFEDTKKYKNVLLGDIHINKYLPFGIEKKGIIGYPGSLELCEAGEPTEKFYSVIKYINGVVTCTQTPVKTRKVIKFKITTSEDLDKLVRQQLATFKNDVPMLLGKYNPKVPDCLPRIQAAMHPDSILRATPIIDLRPDEGMQEINPAENKKLDSFLGAFIPIEAQPDLHNLAVQLLEPGAKASVLITEYVDKNLK